MAKNLYKITDTKTGEVKDNLCYSDIISLFGLKNLHLSEYTETGNKYRERYLIEICNKSEIANDKKLGKKNLEEWRAVTEQLRNKIEWTNQKGKGVRQICLSAYEN